MKVSVHPQKARVLPLGDGPTEIEAWWYESTNSIDVYVYSPRNGHMSCRINRKQLKSWIERTEKREAK